MPMCTERISIVKKYLFTSPLRHWKNGDKKTAIKAYFLNVFLFQVGFFAARWYVAKKEERQYRAYTRNAQ